MIEFQDLPDDNDIQSSGSLSLRRKTLIKRRINREHNSNFYAGYVHVNEEYLHKTGLRGRKCYVMYGVMIILGLVVITNFFVSIHA